MSANIVSLNSHSKFSVFNKKELSVAEESDERICLNEFRDGSSIEQQLVSVKKVNKINELIATKSFHTP